VVGKARLLLHLGVLQVRVGGPAVPGRADQSWWVVGACSLEINWFGLCPALAGCQLPGFDRGGELEGSWRKLGGGERLHRRNDGLPRPHPPAAAAQARGASGPRVSPCRLLPSPPELSDGLVGCWWTIGAGFGVRSEPIHSPTSSKETVKEA